MDNSSFTYDTGAGHIKVNTLDHDGSSIHAQTLSTAGDSAVTVALPDTKGYMVVWEAGGNVKGQRFSSDGVPVGTEIQVNAPGSSISTESEPAAAALADGTAVVAWSHHNGITYRLLNADGSLASQVELAATVEADAHVSVTALPNAGYAFSWVNNGDLHVRAYGGASPQSLDLPGATVGSGDALTKLIALQDGRLVVTWVSVDADGVRSIKAKILGSPDIPEFTVDAVVTDAGTLSLDIVSHNDGRFTITWNDGGHVRTGTWDTRQPQERDIFTWDGGPAGENYVGTTGRDFLNGGDGNDQLSGYDGDDLLDGGAGADIQVKVKDANDAPAMIALSNGSVDENSATGTLVGTLSAIDQDGDAFSFTLVDDAGGRFQIAGDAQTGFKIAVANGALLDYEANGSHSHTIKVQVDDHKGGVATKDIVVSLNDLNDAPTNFTISNDKVDENASAGAVVGALSASDQDGDTLTFTLLDDAGNRFQLVGNQIQVVSGALLDYEAGSSHSHTIKVLVDDGHGGVVTKDIVISLNDQNDLPTNVALSNDKVDENSDPGTAVGTLSAVDQDGDTLTYALVDDAGGRFKLIGNKLQVADGTLLDFEADQSHTIKVQVDDNHGGVVEKTLTVKVNDLVEHATNSPPVNITFSSHNVNENASVGTVVGTLSATDQDGDTLSYMLVDSAGGRFQIVGSEIQVANGALLDFETNPLHTITVRVNDHNGGVVVQDITVDVNDVNEAPANITLTGGAKGDGTVDENSLSGTVVGILAATDPEGDQLTYKLLDSSSRKFKLVGNEIQVENGADLDFEATPSHSHTITIRVKDQHGATLEKDITVNLTNLNDVPQAPAVTVHISEKTANGTVIATLTSFDQDGDPLTYLIDVNGVLQDSDGTFKIEGNHLKVVDNSGLDYETLDHLTLKLVASDGHGGTSQSDFNINLNDGNDAPTGIVLNGQVPVAELAQTGVVVATLAATDQDGDAITFSLTDDAGGAFKIQNGQIVVADGVKLDFEQAQSYTVKVQATDSHGLASIVQSFDIAVTNVLNETIKGTAGNDSIAGAEGNDTLAGGAGMDILTGGAGKDVFVFDTKPNKTTNVDHITDFVAADDTIHLNNAAGLFTKIGNGALKAGAFCLGTKAQDAEDRIIYNTKTGALYYDADGTGTKAAILFAVLDHRENTGKITYKVFFVL